MSISESATEPEWLFVYGTLRPRDERERESGGWIRDAVRGRLYDLGPYPALVDCADESAGWVEGDARRAEARELVEVLDPYEETDQGLYRRIAVRTRQGLYAWVYEYARKLPAEAVGLSQVWRPRAFGDDEELSLSP